MSSKAKLPVQTEKHGGEQEKRTIQAGALELMTPSSHECNLANLNNPSEIYVVVQLYLKQAQLYLIQNSYEKAISACKEALRVSPDTAEAYKIWGDVLQIKGLTADAMGAYARAIQIRPDYSDVYANLGSLYARQKKWKEAIQYYQKAISINPKFAGVYNNLGKIWAKLNQPDKQFVSVSYALLIEPQLGTAEDHYFFGNRYLKDGKLEYAIKFFRNAIDAKPNFICAIEKLANILDQRGDWKAAAHYYRKSLIYQKSDQPHSKPTLTFQKKQRQENLEASSILGNRSEKQKLLPVSNERLPIINTKSVQKKNNNVEMQIQHLNKILIKNPNSCKLHFVLGNLYIKINKIDKAIIHYKIALRLDIENVDIYRKLAALYFKIGKKEKSAEYLYKVFTLEPSLSTADQEFFVGNILIQNKKIEKATISFLRAIRKKTNHETAYNNLIQILKFKDSSLDTDIYIQRIICSIKKNVKNKVQISSNRKNNYTEYKTTVSESKLYPNNTGKETLIDETSNSDKDNLDFDRQCVNSVSRNNPSITGNGKNHTIKLAIKKLAEAKLYEKQEKWQKAISIYQLAVNLNPHLWEGYHNLAELYRKMEQYDEAIESFKKAIKINPEFSWSYNNLGLIYQKLNRWEDALESYCYAAVLNPKFVWTHYSLGDVFSALNDWNAAALSYSNAIKISTNLPYIGEKISEARSKSSNYNLEEEVDLLKQNIVLNQSDLHSYFRLIEYEKYSPNLFIQLGSALVRENKQGSALVFYKMALILYPNEKDILTEVESLQLKMSGK